MIDYIILGVSFLNLFLGIFWINIYYLSLNDRIRLKKMPLVNVLVPVYNGADVIINTLKALINLDYPKKKIIVINDDSTDNTREVVENFIKDYNYIILINRKKESGQVTKAPALNEGLKYIDEGLVACVDDDTIVSRDGLKHIIPYFYDEKVGAVISTIKPLEIKTLWEKIQRLEYIFSTFVRKLMAKIDTLHITPGALSVYRKEVFDKYGGFDEANITEDLEIAMRLHYNGYKVKIATESVVYTKVPENFKALWRQRVRWFRGFIYNNWKYKEMFMNKKYSLMGLFQYPLNIITLASIILMFCLLSFKLFDTLYYFIIRLLVIKFEFFRNLSLSNLEEVIYFSNFKLMLPVMISFSLALFIYYKSHKFLN